MPGITAFYDTDILELENSFNAIRNKDAVEIVSDEPERARILRKILDVMSLPHRTSFSIQNLFKFNLSNGQFYIAQCLLDHGHPVKGRAVQTLDHSYDYQIVGFGESTVELGKSFIRPETKSDKLVGRFFKSDIEVENAESFNEKYYLASDEKDQVLKAFDKNFLNTFSSYNNLYLYTKGKDIFITFDRELQPEQSRMIEDIFSGSNI